MTKEIPQSTPDKTKEQIDLLRGLKRLARDTSNRPFHLNGSEVIILGEAFDLKVPPQDAERLKGSRFYLSPTPISKLKTPQDLRQFVEITLGLPKNLQEIRSPSNGS